MSVVSLSILAYGLSGVLLALGLLPFWRDGGSRVDVRLLLAGLAVAVLSALFVFGDASTTRLLAIVVALGGGAVAGGLAVFRRNTRDAGEQVPAAVATAGLVWCCWLQRRSWRRTGWSAFAMGRSGRATC
jgi:hypothetical protein